MAKYSNKDAQFDTVIVGDNLVALALAAVMQTDRKVAILHPGKELRAMQNLNFIPNHPQAVELIKWFENFLDLNIMGEIVEHSPLSIDSGSLIPFSGFGDLKFESGELLNYYNTQSYIKLNLTCEEIMSRFIELYSGEVLSNCELTSIEVENKKITALMANGAKKIVAEQYIFCGSPKKIIALMDSTQLNSKFVQKMSKQQEWAAVQLYFSHEAELMSESHLHILFGNKTDFEPCLGRFFEFKEGAQNSVWTSFVPMDLMEDSEHLTAVVKYMKRQIKRVYKDGAEPISEKIIVSPSVSAQTDLDLNGLNVLSQLENSLWASPLSSEFEGLLGLFDITKELTEQYKSSKSLESPLGVNG